MTMGNEQSVNAYVNSRLMPIMQRLSKVEAEMTALGVAIKKVENSLDSTDMRAQNELDKLDYLRLDIISQHDSIRNDVERAIQAANNLSKAMKAKRSGVAFSSSEIATHANEFSNDITSDDYINSQKRILNDSFHTINAKNNSMSNNLSAMTTKVSGWGKLKVAFKQQYSSFFNRRREESKNFSNGVNSNIDTGRSVNELNILSADFSNHVGDMRSQVHSCDQDLSDFNSDDNHHRVVLPWSDVNFANEKLYLQKDHADFKDIQINYNKSSNQSKTGPKESILSKILSIFRGKSSPLGAKPYKWRGGNQYKNTSTHARTWQGGNQYMNFEQTEFQTRYKSRGRGAMGSLEEETMGRRLTRREIMMRRMRQAREARQQRAAQRRSRAAMARRSRATSRGAVARPRTREEIKRLSKAQRSIRSAASGARRRPMSASRYRRYGRRR